MNQNNMRKLVVSEWVTLDGVFDADIMEQWFNPYHSDDSAEYPHYWNVPLAMVTFFTMS
jgi:hypothetical protein